MKDTRPAMPRHLHDAAVDALTLRTAEAEDRLVRLIALLAGDAGYLQNAYAGDWLAAADALLEQYGG